VIITETQDLSKKKKKEAKRNTGKYEPERAKKYKKHTNKSL